MAKLTAQKIDKSGSVKTYAAAAAAGDTFDSFNGVLIHAKNVNVGTRTITITTVDDPIITPGAGSLAVPDIVVTVPASGDALFAVPASHLSNAGLATMTYDDETDLTLAVFYVAQ